MTRSPLRRPALWVWLALVLAGAWLAQRAHYVADLSAFLPARPTAEQRVLLEQIRQGTTARVLLIGIRGSDAATRAQASQSLAKSLRESGRFDAVHNGDRGDSAALGEFLFAHRYLLSPAVDAKRFEVAGLRDAMADTASLLGTPAGNLVKPLIWRDPTGETVRMAEAMLPAAAPRVEDGVWVSRVAPRAVLIATTHAEGADLDGQALAQAEVREAFAPLAAQGLQLELSGPGVFGVTSRSVIEGEVERLAKWGTGIMVCMLLLSFGSLRALLIALLPVASGVLAGIAAVSLGFGHVHGMTLGFGTTLLGEAVDYAIYYLLQARLPAGAPPGTGHVAWKLNSWPTVRLGLWTSITGFAALVFSGFGGLAQLGVFSVAGLVAAALTTRFVLPIFAPDGATGRGLRSVFGRLTARGIAVLPRLHWVFGFAALGALAALLLLPSAWHGTLAGLSPVTPAAMALDESLRNDLGAGDSGVLVATEGADAATALAAAERAGTVLDRLLDQGVITGYDSPARLLPSVALQRERQAALPDADTLRTRLAEASEGGPLPAARLEPFIADVQAQRAAPPITRAQLAGTPLESALQAQLLPGRDGAPWAALVQVHAAGELDVKKLRDAFAAQPEVRIVPVQPVLTAIYDRYLREALWQVGIGIAVVLLLLGWHLRSLRALADVVLPLATSVVLVLGGLTLAGVSLGLLHLVGLLLVVAVGSNYALFFHQLRTQPGTDEDTLASLLIANLTLVLSFALLCTSHVPVLVALGQAVAPGALLSLVLSAAFSRPVAGRSAA